MGTGHGPSRTPRNDDAQGWPRCESGADCVDTRMSDTVRSTMLGSFLIFLREGIEGSMIVTIICLYLVFAGRRDLFRAVFTGVGAALVSATVVGVVLYALVKDVFIDSAAQTWVETAIFLLAVAVLTSMTFWMKGQARTMSSALQDQVSAAMTGGSALALI